MLNQPPDRKQALRANSLVEIKPLIELCKAGKLFEVQAWIAAGGPVNPPQELDKRASRSPLEVAIDTGFHSMVEVLLKAGVEFSRHGYSAPMSKALQLRRFDLVRLMVEHGYDASTVNLRDVFNTWDADLVEYFIDRGADAETGRPLAYALCQRIRTALRVFKRYRERFPSFQEQANIALRHHCREGNLKWVSLMIWAGADPLSRGVYEVEDQRDADEGISAVGLAALYGHYEILALKQVRLDPKHPSAFEVARYARKESGLRVLEKLLKAGMEVNDQPNGGCSILQSLLTSMDWEARLSSLRRWNEDQGLDSQEARDKMEAVHNLAENGARWLPLGSGEINAVRRSLLKLTPEYTVEFVGIMSHFRATERANLDALMRSRSIANHVAKYQERVAKLLGTMSGEA